MSVLSAPNEKSILRPPVCLVLAPHYDPHEITEGDLNRPENGIFILELGSLLAKAHAQWSWIGQQNVCPGITSLIMPKAKDESNSEGNLGIF